MEKVAAARFSTHPLSTPARGVVKLSSICDPSALIHTASDRRYEQPAPRLRLSLAPRPAVNQPSTRRQGPAGGGDGAAAAERQEKKKKERATRRLSKEAASDRFSGAPMMGPGFAAPDSAPGAAPSLACPRLQRTACRRQSAAADVPGQASCFCVRRSWLETLQLGRLMLLVDHPASLCTHASRMHYTPQTAF